MGSSYQSVTQRSSGRRDTASKSNHDDDGVIRTFCVYGAPTKVRAREHSAVLGCRRVDDIYEIAGDINPADLPS